ncbi:SDR family oxidoreductase [Krasilnikovia sp. MM14-A1259]|uniref:SDR family oxidoreductase n=1 Tax=Krasilnikovia sp. MM14-A1259 TaxID=3373539 RepID=UPI003816CE0D
MTTLVTGADGYLGRRIAARLLATGDEALLLTVRAADPAELAAKRTSLLAELGADAARRATVTAVDLTAPDAFASVQTRGVRRIVHAAARTAFTVDRDTAEAVNVAGAERIADHARRCPGLERVVALSTLFSAGRRSGLVTEDPHDVDPGFVNWYEWSKYTAEQRLLAGYADLPLTVARLATVVADDDTGTVIQHNAFHNTLKLFFYGLMSLVPGDPATPMYLATADFTARGVAYLADPRTPDGCYHVAPAPAEAIALGELIDAAFEVFDADPGFRRRRLLRPEFCDVQSFRDLVDAAHRFGAGPLRQAAASVAPFTEQLFLPKEFDNRRLRTAWGDYAVPPSRQLVAAACTELVRTRWGRTGGSTS